MSGCLCAHLNIAGAKERFASPKLHFGKSYCKINSPSESVNASVLQRSASNEVIAQPKVCLGDRELKFTNIPEIYIFKNFK